MGADTIAAIATPPGRGGIGVVRISGKNVAAISERLLGGIPTPRYAGLHRFCDHDGALIDTGLALYFPGPHSYTGEDVLELQGHGGPVVMDLLLKRVLELGARMARPGEFSERAFVNGKLDLAQAEAVADLIDSSTAQAARAAASSLSGTFSERIHDLLEGLIKLRIYVESAIDFPEEEIDFLSDGHIDRQLSDLRGQLALLLSKAGQGRLLRDGMRVVIAGRPNAGKSSLLNRLVEREAAIVTAIAGTTRDILREHISIDGMPLHVIDTAGLRTSDDPVEQEGIRRAWREIETADRVLLMIDAQIGMTDEDSDLANRLPENIPVTLIYNKIDLTGENAAILMSDPRTEVRVSAKTGQGMEGLRQHLKDCIGFEGAGEGLFSARRRHLDALQRAQDRLREAHYQLQEVKAGELVAEELRLAHNALAEITGEFSSDDLLARIFASFCIGK